MRGVPSTLAGWIVLYLFLIVVAVIAAWVITGLDLPQGVANIVVAVVSGYIGILTGRMLEQLGGESKITTTTVDSTKTEPPV